MRKSMMKPEHELYELIAEAKISSAKLRVISNHDSFTLIGLITQMFFFIGLGVFCVGYISTNSSNFLSQSNEQNTFISIIATLLFLGTIVSLLGIRHSFLQFLNYRYRQEMAKRLLSEYEFVMTEVENHI